MTNLTANLRLDEKLDWISEAKTLEEQVTRTKQVAELDITFLPLMRMAVTEKEKLCGGMKKKISQSYGVPLTTVRQEYRTISKFVLGGSYTETPSPRRNEIWSSLIEGLHWKEATMLTHIKDQTLLVIHPCMREVLTQLGMLISVPLVSVKPSKKKNIKKAPKAPAAPGAPKAPKEPKLPWFKTLLK